MDKQESQSFGKCIWQARRKKGLSQRELAVKVGVDYTYLSKLENDHVEPSEKVIRSLAEHLSLNALELIYLAGRMTQNDSEALEELVKANYKEMPALFRRVQENPGIDSLVKARDERITRLQKENAELKAKVSSLEKELQIYNFYSKKEIECVANNTLKLMHKNNYPPRWPMDASRVADSLDIAISFAKIFPDEQGPIVAKILPWEREIILNQDIQELQGKLHESTIAHEIGHWLMHVTQYKTEKIRKEINNNIEVEETQNIFLCRSIIEQLDTYKVNIKHDHIEWQAEYFASCLLMPTFKLEEVRRGRDLTKWHHIYAIADDLGVTISKLINRLQDIGWVHIPKGSKQIFLGNIESESQQRN